jgi:hypothetical protein
MLIPALAPICRAGAPLATTNALTPLPVAFAALKLHSIAMLSTITVVSLVVYHWAGVDFLRRGWINIDRIRVGVLGACGIALLLT